MAKNSASQRCSSYCRVTFIIGDSVKYSNPLSYILPAQSQVRRRVDQILSSTFVSVSQTKFFVERELGLVPGVLVINWWPGGCGILFDTYSRFDIVLNILGAYPVTWHKAIVHSFNADRGCSSISMTVWDLFVIAGVSRSIFNLTVGPCVIIGSSFPYEQWHNVLIWFGKNPLFWNKRRCVH